MILDVQLTFGYNRYFILLYVSYYMSVLMNVNREYAEWMHEWMQA